MRNPWVAIMRASMRGDGLHLSAEEVGLLAGDGAIEACALNDADAVGIKVRDWALVDPHKILANGNR